jgi:hypothetical protein
MKHDTNKEVERRKAAALASIKRTMDKDEGEYGAGLFVSHHLEELDATYWEKHTGSARPTPKEVLDLLELRSHWDGDDDMGVFDFTLPGDVTNYVIAVRFDENGKIEDISMES